MESQDFTASIIVENTPQEVFDAVNNVPAWWTGNITGDTKKLGDEFKYQYGDTHRSTQKITEFVPGKKVVWHVTDSYIGFVEDKKEWNDTDIIFEISEKGDKTELVFTHKGLVPPIACYDNCSRAWGMLINSNLRNLIITGKSQTEASIKSS
jgi:hypothetical protein